MKTMHNLNVITTQFLAYGTERVNKSMKLLLSVKGWIYIVIDFCSNYLLSFFMMSSFIAVAFLNVLRGTRFNLSMCNLCSTFKLSKKRDFLFETPWHFLWSQTIGFPNKTFFPLGSKCFDASFDTRGTVLCGSTTLHPPEVKSCRIILCIIQQEHIVGNHCDFHGFKYFQSIVLVNYAISIQQ